MKFWKTGIVTAAVIALLAACSPDDSGPPSYLADDSHVEAGPVGQ
jgi:hypothetical protein